MNVRFVVRASAATLGIALIAASGAAQTAVLAAPQSAANGDPAVRAVLLPSLLRAVPRSTRTDLRTLASANWTESELYTFGASTTDGYGPNALTYANGELYGTTYGGGTNGDGTVFKLSPPRSGHGAWTESTLYSFGGSTTDGTAPLGAVIVDRDGAIYGTTSAGGSNFDGTVFKLTPPASATGVWTETVLYAFAGGADGVYPYAGLIAFHGRLYGTTQSGGANYAGTVFELTPPAARQSGWTESIVHTFESQAGDGGYPLAGFIEFHGALVSTTSGGGTLGQGTVFALSPPAAGQTAWNEHILHSFDGFDGAAPSGNVLADSHGVLYGTTSGGGLGGCLPTYLGGCGTVFELAPPTRGQTAWTLQTLHYFNAGEGYVPQGGLTGDARGNLYGMSNGGAQSNGGQDLGDGTVFKLSPPARGAHHWSETVLHAFTGGVDGADPASNNLLLDPNGALYGATTYGGTGGVFFRLTPR